MRYIILIVIAVMFSGCFCSEPKVKIVHKYYQLDKNIIKDDINISRLPNKQMYIKANPLDRESLLRDYIINILGNINSYKIKLSKLNKQDEKIKKEIDKLNKQDTK